MTQESLSAFHEQLLLFLQEDLQKKKSMEGWDERVDPEMQTYRDLLSRAIRTAGPLCLEEILERYQLLFTERGPVHLERKLLEAFSEREMQHCKLPPLRIVRGLPRLYCKDRPTRSKIKEGFADLPSLKRTAASKAIYSLYGAMPIPADAKIALLTWVMPDGWGDYTALIETAELIQRAFPSLGLRLFTIAEQELPKERTKKIERWTGSKTQLKWLRSCDLILQIPTIYPKIEELKQELEAVNDAAPLPKWESVGQYGFLESGRYQPRSGLHCMGLHFLEKGMLIRPSSSAPSLSELENETLTEWLFDQMVPGPMEIDRYRRERRFFLAYLFSEPGIFVYLHALLKSLEWDKKDIDVCIPDAEKMLLFLQERSRQGKNLLEKSYKVRQVILQIGSHLTVFPIEKEGKTVRLLCPGPLSRMDFQRLLAFSEDFVACRGDQSFSEIVSRNKGFFYDPRDHSRYFVKDLIALAENRIPLHRSTVGILRLFAKVLELNLLSDEGTWIDEIAIQRQEPMTLLEIAEMIGVYLQDPDALAGFKKLNRILADEYSCNAFLLHLVQRAICHRRFPQLASLEEEEVTRFIYNQQPLSHLIEHMSGRIASLMNV